KEAITLYVQDAVSRLRSENLLCGCIISFVQSNPFDTSEPFYNKSLSYALPDPSDNSLLLSKRNYPFFVFFNLDCVLYRF
ncbi:hypothetical protein ABFO79_14960, partial [Acinetobacter schindleri]